MMRRFGKVMYGVALCATFGLIAGTVSALETVTLRAPGASDGLKDDLRAASLIVAAKRDGVSNPQDVLAAARADYARLTGVLYARGRYSSVIQIKIDGREVAGISPLDGPAQINQVDLIIHPGPVFRFGLAQVTPLPPMAMLPSGFAPGELARSELIQEAASAGVSAWRDAGHAKADVAAQSLRADHRREILDARLTMRPGPQLRFGQLHLEGDSRVRDRRVRKIAGFPEGEVFNPAALEEVARRLRRTGSFRSVALREAEEPNQDGTLDVTARLVDEKRRRIGFGAEYSTIEGATVSGYWMHRNLLGGAERLRLDAKISGITGETGGTDLSFGARYTRPATPDPESDLFVDFQLERLEEPDFTATQYTFGVGLEKHFSEELSATVAIEWQHIRVSDPVETAGLDVLSLPMTATWDRRDTPLDAKAGTYLYSELRPFLASGRSSGGVRMFADARSYFAVTKKLTLAGRLQFGSVAGPSVATSPPDYLFYSGGGGTVRGQSYQSLDIDLGNGRRRGGRSFVGLSAEARMTVKGNWGVVGFADAGYVGAGSFPDGSGEWHAGAGLGLRYDTGIGPIRFDLAVPVGGDGSGLQLYVGIGQAF